MSLQLNTSHPLVSGNKLVFLIAVDDNNTLVDLVTPSRVITPNLTPADAGSAAGFGTGPWGRHFFTGGQGYNDGRGAAISPGISIPNNYGTLIVITHGIYNFQPSPGYFSGPLMNAVDRSGGFNNALPAIVAAGSNKLAVFAGPSGFEYTVTDNTTPYAFGSSADRNAAKRFIAFTRPSTSGTSRLYHQGVEIATAVDFAFDQGGGGFNQIGGEIGRSFVQADIVYLAWIDQVLTATEIADLYASLGANNQFALVSTLSATAPTPTTHPATQSRVDTQSVTFTAAFDGVPVPNLQWQVSTNGGSTWSNISGATTGTYTFTCVLADSTKKFRCGATNSAGGPVYTNAATLTVTPLYGLPMNTLSEFGSRTGLAIDTFAVYASKPLDVIVFDGADHSLTTPLFRYSEVTGTNGKLARKTHPSLVTGSVYLLVCIDENGNGAVIHVTAN